VSPPNPVPHLNSTMKLCLPVVIVALLPFGLRAAARVGGLEVAASEPAAAAAPTKYDVDPVHSSGVFRTKHLVSPFWGSFHAVSGSVSYDKEHPEASSVEVVIDPAKVASGNAKRDEHLRGVDFFSVKEFPEIRFKSTRVAAKADGKLEMAGDLTLHGKTKAVVATVEVTGEGETSQGYRAGFEASFDIQRSEFGMAYAIPDLGDEVRVIVALECIRK
jgi:polyisoprenoid-binding protein YceI